MTRDNKDSQNAHQEQLEAQEWAENEKKPSFAKEIWDEMSAINVNDRTEKKGQLTYLSWAWAWQTLMERYPESRYKWHEPRYEPDRTMTVSVSITIKRGDNRLKRKMLLPVLDYKNRSIVEPDAFAINTARMRCLAKCLSMFGLGAYIYAGEDLPISESKAVKERLPRIPHKIHLKKTLEAMDGAGTLAELQFQFEGGYRHFKKWNADDEINKLTKHKDTLKKTFKVSGEEV